MNEDHISNEVLKTKILPNLEFEKFKSPALIRNLFNIMQSIGLQNINIDQNENITIGGAK